MDTFVDRIVHAMRPHTALRWHQTVCGIKVPTSAIDDELRVGPSVTDNNL